MKINKPQSRFLRLHHIIGCRKRGISSIVPVSASVWWRLVRENKAPQPVKIGKTTNWYEDEVYEFMNSFRASRS